MNLLEASKRIFGKINSGQRGLNVGILPMSEARADFPAEFDPVCYRRYADLAHMDDSALRDHWTKFGLAEGRFASDIITRNKFLEGLRSRRSVLEIGPFDRPVMESVRTPGMEIRYADYLSTQQLIERANALIDRDSSSVPLIDYVLSEMAISDITRKFDAVISCHCLEHQANFIRHILDVASILNVDGVYACLIPDKRCCFDYFIPNSQLPEFIAAYLEGRQRPSLRSIIEHMAFTKHDFQSSPDPFTRPHAEMRPAIDFADSQYKTLPYVDVHCWYFTTHSIRYIVNGLITLDFLPATTTLKVFPLGGEIGLVFSF